MKQLVTGHASVDRKLRQLGPRVGNKVIRQAMRAAMRPLLKEVKSLEPTETGDLKKSIALRAGKRSRAGASMMVLMGDRGFKGAKWYGAFRDLGTRLMAGSKGFRRAFDHLKKSVRSDAVKRIKRGVADQLKSMGK